MDAEGSSCGLRYYSKMFLEELKKISARIASLRAQAIPDMNQEW
jgi:hypothetical protein